MPKHLSDTVVFVSYRDKNSRRLLQQMKQQVPLLQIEIVDIDKTPDQVPAQITHIPTVITGVASPKKTMHVGTGAFEWLKTKSHEFGKVSDYDEMGTMGGTSLGFSHIQGVGLIESQAPFESIG